MNLWLPLQRAWTRLRYRLCDWNGGGGEKGYQRRTRLLARAIALDIPLDGVVRLSTGWFSTGRFDLFSYLLTSEFMSYGAPEVKRGLVRRAIRDGFTCPSKKGFELAQDVIRHQGDLTAFQWVMDYEGFWQANPPRQQYEVPDSAGWLARWALEYQPPEHIPGILAAIATRFPTLESERTGDILDRIFGAAKTLTAAFPLDQAELLGQQLGVWARVGLGKPSPYLRFNVEDLWQWHAPFFLQPPPMPVRLYLSGLVQVLYDQLHAIEIEAHSTSALASLYRARKEPVTLSQEHQQKYPWLADLSEGRYPRTELFARHPFWRSCLPQQLMADRLQETLSATPIAPAARPRL